MVDGFIIIWTLLGKILQIYTLVQLQGRQVAAKMGGWTRLVIPYKLCSQSQTCEQT